ncbi:MAG TPA: hypothetical protein VK806_05640 [Bacteroidia bacterium]|jgi:hypothetical protein|nr:hypothetical protein [Bacteroidia bacterium]
MRRSIIIFIVAIIACAFTPRLLGGGREGITADQVINDYIKVMGGKDKLNSIKTLYMEGEINSNGRKIPVKKWYVNGKAVRYESSFNGITSYTIVRTDSGWRYNPGRGQKVPEPLTAAILASNKPDLDLAGTLVDYAAKGYKVVYEGTEDIEGTEAYKIEEIINDKLIYTFFFDPDSHYIMRLRTKSSLGVRVTTSSTDFSFYQPTADGYVFSMEQGNTRISTIKVNGDIDPKLFIATK